MKDILEESIGGVVTQKPFGNMFEEEKSTDLLRIAKELVAKEGEKKLMTKEDLVSSVNEFSTYGPSIYKKHNLADVAKTFVEIAEAAQKHVVDETKDWFDGVTVKRNMNELKKQATQFNKIATEAQALQDRMAALYEDMGGILNRYFDIKEISDPLPDRDKDGNLTNPLEIEKRKLVQQSKEMSAKAEKADGFKAKQPFLKKRQQIQMKIKDINRRLGR